LQLASGECRKLTFVLTLFAFNCQRLKPRVNFNNILCTNFSYLSFAQSFFCNYILGLNFFDTRILAQKGSLNVGGFDHFLGSTTAVARNILWKKQVFINSNIPQHIGYNFGVTFCKLLLLFRNNAIDY
jgi:hypothetical protein